MKSVFLFFMAIGSAFALPPAQSKVYRKDYVYNRKTDAFYKFHIDSVTKTRAVDLCQLEGATLMVPSSQEDLVQAHEMMKKFPDLGDLIWIGDDGQKHDSVEVTPIIDLTPKEEDITYEDCEVLNTDGVVNSIWCYSALLPFICKVQAKVAPYDERCGVHGNVYKYLESTHSCYRVPRLPLTWNAAYAECQNDDGHLIVLNSEVEHLAIKKFLKTAPAVTFPRAIYFYYAGIRAERTTDGTPRVFRTIFNETLEQAGYSGWSAGEPNNYLDTEYCGSIFLSDGKYNDLGCSYNYGFICEKEAQ